MVRGVNCVNCSTDQGGLWIPPKGSAKHDVGVANAFSSASRPDGTFLHQFNFSGKRFTGNLYSTASSTDGNLARVRCGAGEVGGLHGSEQSGGGVPLGALRLFEDGDSAGVGGGAGVNVEVRHGAKRCG